MENKKRTRNNKGQFIITTGSEPYKNIQYNNKKMGEHRKVWILNNGEIPKGYIVHHINGNKKDNRIENLKCMSCKDHNKIHLTGRTTWNKGLPKEKQPAFGRKYQFKQSSKNKQKVTWFLKYLDSNIKIWKMKDKNKNVLQISKQLNLTKDQINHRWRGFNKSYLSWTSNII